MSIGGSENFYSVFEADLEKYMPVIKCSIGGTRIIGRVTCGNKKGLLVPQITTDNELKNIRNSLPEEVVVIYIYIYTYFCYYCEINSH